MILQHNLYSYAEDPLHANGWDFRLLIPISHLQALWVQGISENWPLVSLHLKASWGTPGPRSDMFARRPLQVFQNCLDGLLRNQVAVQKRSAQYVQNSTMIKSYSERFLLLSGQSQKLVQCTASDAWSRIAATCRRVSDVSPRITTYNTEWNLG